MIKSNLYNEILTNCDKEIMKLDLLYDKYLQIQEKQILLDKLHDRIFNEFENSLIDDFEKYINIIGKYIKNQIDDIDYLRCLLKTIEKVSEINKQVKRLVKSKVDYYSYGYKLNVSILDILYDNLKKENDEVIKQYLKGIIAKIEVVLKQQEDRINNPDQLPLYNFIDRRNNLLFDKARTLDDYMYCLKCYQIIINHNDFGSNSVILEYLNERITQSQNIIDQKSVEDSYFIDLKPFYEKKIITPVDALLFVKRDINNERIECIRYVLEKNSYLVAIGSKVRILFLDDGELEDFKIVEDYYEDYYIDYKRVYGKTFEDSHILNPGELSAISPIAKEVIGKRKGDIVNINAPNGRFNVQIIDITWIGK